MPGMAVLRSLVVASFGLACMLPAQETRPPAADARVDAKLMSAARRLRARGDEAAAQASARELVERQPDHFEARAFLGQQFFRGRWRLPEEIAYLRRVEQRELAATAPSSAAAPQQPPAPPARPAA